MLNTNTRFLSYYPTLKTLSHNNKETLGPHNRYEESIYAEKREGILVVKRREKRGVQVHIRVTEERVY